MYDLFYKWAMPLGYVKVGMGSKNAESFYSREIVLVSELAR